MTLLNPGDQFPALSVPPPVAAPSPCPTTWPVASASYSSTGVRGATIATPNCAAGAFVNDAPSYLQSTGFVLDPDGNVVVSVYSSGAIGRLVPDDVVGLIRYLRQHTSTSAQTTKL